MTCTSQLLCRWSSVWACLIFFHDLNEVIYFCQEYHRHDLGPFVHHIKDFIVSTCLITGSVTHDHLDKIVISRFFHCKVTIFPFVVDKYFWRDSLTLCKFYFSTNFYPLFLDSSSGASLHQLLPWWMLTIKFSISLFLPTCDIRNSTLRKSCLFFSTYLFGDLSISIWTYRYFYIFIWVLSYGFKSKAIFLFFPTKLFPFDC